MTTCPHIEHHLEEFPDDLSLLNLKKPCFNCEELTDRWFCLTCFEVSLPLFLPLHSGMNLFIPITDWMFKASSWTCCSTCFRCWTSLSDAFSRLKSLVLFVWPCSRKRFIHCYQKYCLPSNHWEN